MDQMPTDRQALQPHVEYSIGFSMCSERGRILFVKILNTDCQQPTASRCVSTAHIYTKCASTKYAREARDTKWNKEVYPNSNWTKLPVLAHIVVGTIDTVRRQHFKIFRNPSLPKTDGGKTWKVLVYSYDLFNAINQCLNSCFIKLTKYNWLLEGCTTTYILQ